MNLKDTYDKIAENWSDDHAKDVGWIQATDAFLSLIPKGSSILDVGCGAGFKAKYISEKGYKVTGIDFSQKMVALSNKKFPLINFEVIDIYEIDKYSKKFDGIFAQAVILHIPKAKVLDILEKIKTRLNPKGILYIGVKSIREGETDEDILKESDYGYPYERFFSYFNAVELREYVNKLNMKLVWQGKYISGKTTWLQIIARNEK